MNNNPNDFNHLINQFVTQKRKDRKHLLQIEIAKATDRAVKQSLQKILDDIERKERWNRIIAIILVIMMILVVLFFLGTKSTNQSSGSHVNQPVSSVTKDESIIKSDTKQETQQETQKEKHLSESEVKQWVSAIWEKEYANNSDWLRYQLNVTLNENDSLVYVTLQGAGQNFYKKFRINANGELEKDDASSWVVVSKKFMDTSSVVENTNQTQEIDTTKLNSEEAINWVKNYRHQYEGINDEKDNKFKPQFSKEQCLEIVVYSWNLTKTAQTISSVYRINQDGYLEKGDPNTFSHWEVVSAEYID